MPGDRSLAAPAPLPPSEVPADDARRVARDILSRAEYQPPERSLVDRAWGWLQDQLDRLLGGLGGSGGGYWVGISVLLVAVAAAVWFLARILPRPVRRPRPGGPAPAVAETSRPSRRQLLDRAAAAEAEGRWADAVADRYRALVLGLAERRVLPDDPAVTTGELRRAFRGDVEQRRAFEAASDRFDRVRYRGDPAGPEDPARLQDWDRRLVGGNR